VSSPTLGVDRIELPTPSVEVEVPRTSCIKGGPVIGMPTALAWLEPLDASLPALRIDGIEPPTPRVEVDMPRTPCIKEECPAPLKEGPAPPKVGLCEHN